jgi:hypothetical protein
VWCVWCVLQVCDRVIVTRRSLLHGLPLSAGHCTLVEYVYSVLHTTLYCGLTKCTCQRASAGFILSSCGVRMPLRQPRQRAPQTEHAHTAAACQEDTIQHVLADNPYLSKTVLEFRIIIEEYTSYGWLGSGGAWHKTRALNLRKPVIVGRRSHDQRTEQQLQLHKRALSGSVGARQLMKPGPVTGEPFVDGESSSDADTVRGGGLT